MSETTDVKSAYPLHYYVWHNNAGALDELLQQKKYDTEQLDPRGRTPLMLAVTLDNLEAACVLLRHSADASFISKQYWSVLQEAISTGDPQLVRVIMLHRDSQVAHRQGLLMTELLKKLRETPDFYIEIKWEFTSWLPHVSRMCPSDVCRVWKSGPNVRIDTSLIAFDKSSSWVRGHLSYIFRVNNNEALMDEVNHTDRTIYRYHMVIPSYPEDDASPSSIANAAAASAGAGATARFFVPEPSDELVAKKLTQPIFVTYLDTDKIAFEKSKSGIWGWRTDRKEMVNNYNCQVYCASNVQLVTLRRTEHLTEENLNELNQTNASKDTEGGGADIVFPGGHKNPLTNLLQTATGSHDLARLDVSHKAASYNPNEITLEDYFNPAGSVRIGVDIGRPKSMTTKVKTFKTRLWLCSDFQLSLKDQVIPIVDLMSEYNPYFYKLKEFLTEQLPDGFPIKIEIPLYHILNARISFSNLHGQETPVTGLTPLTKSTGGRSPLATDRGAADKSPEPSDSNKQSVGGTEATTSAETVVSCAIDDSVFDVGKGYHVVVENSPGHCVALDEEEQMVQMAVQRSLIEYGAADNLLHRDYSLRKRSIIESKANEYVEPEEAWLQQAIAASLHLDGAEIPVTSADEAYMKVLEESRLQQEREEQLRRQEDEELRRALELSVNEK